MMSSKACRRARPGASVISLPGGSSQYTGRRFRLPACARSRLDDQAAGFDPEPVDRARQGRTAGVAAPPGSSRTRSISSGRGSRPEPEPLDVEAEVGGRSRGPLTAVERDPRAEGRASMPCSSQAAGRSAGERGERGGTASSCRSGICPAISARPSVGSRTARFRSGRSDGLPQMAAQERVHLPLRRGSPVRARPLRAPPERPRRSSAERGVPSAGGSWGLAMSPAPASSGTSPTRHRRPGRTHDEQTSGTRNSPSRSTGRPYHPSVKSARNKGFSRVHEIAVLI